MKFFYNLEKFVKTLKNGDIKNIEHAMSSIVYDGQKIIDRKTKINILADNVCSLKLEVLAQIIPLFGIKYTDGLTTPMYVTSVDCSEQVFGFLSSYYSIDKKTRFLAYKEALKKNKINILKKINGVSTTNLEKLRTYSKNNKSVKDITKEYVASDYRKSRSSKDTSPEDFLKKKLKKKIKDNIDNLQKSLVKKWKFVKIS